MDDGTNGSVGTRAPPAAAITAAAGAALTVAVVGGVLAWSGPGERVLSAVVYGLVVAVPMAVGALTLARRPANRFAWVLVAAAALWSVTSLATATSETPYSIGRLAIWAVEPAAVYLLLAFPSGRLSSQGARRLTVAALALVLVLYLPTALLVGHYPDPGPGMSCGAD